MVQIIGTKISRSRWKVVNIITNVGVIKTINKGSNRNERIKNFTL